MTVTPSWADPDHVRTTDAGSQRGQQSNILTRASTSWTPTLLPATTVKNAFVKHSNCIDWSVKVWRTIVTTRTTDTFTDTNHQPWWWAT